MAEKGAVAFQFERLGLIRLQGRGDDLELQAIDAGAQDVIEEDNDTLVYVAPSDLSKVRDRLKEAGLEITEVELTYVPKNTINITDKEAAGKIMRLMEAIEELDDVTNSYVNFEIDESLLN
jgi:transcriptional/translational regulatory protein YebC/TACO1